MMLRYINLTRLITLTLIKKKRKHLFRESVHKNDKVISSVIFLLAFMGYFCIIICRNPLPKTDQNRYRLIDTGLKIICENFKNNLRAKLMLDKKRLWLNYIPENIYRFHSMNICRSIAFQKKRSIDLDLK